MDYNSSDYFTYKRNKMRSESSRQKKPISKFSFLIQLFVATFIIIFILIVFSIMKYSAKVDIEYSRSEIPEFDKTNKFENFSEIQESEQKRIDKRLFLIQQEENAPNEAKIIAEDKENNIVIDPELVEKNKKIDKKHLMEFKEKQELKQQLKKEQEESSTKTTEQTKTNEIPLPSVKNLLKEEKQEQKQEIKPQVQESNVIIMSKVLVGRYSTFEEAQSMQTTIKAQNPSLTPYVKKVGNVFSVQMGSYQDFNVAKRYAQTLQLKGLDVWIYQQ